MALGLFHFQLLHHVLERIHYTHDRDALASTVLVGISEALDAEGGTIFLLEPNGALTPLASHGAPIERLRQVPFSTGRGVVGWVVQHSQPVKVDTPEQDTRFVGSIDAITGFKTKNIVAAPILVKGNVVGVIEYLNKKAGPFTIPDLELVSMMGREVGIAFENTRLIKDLQHAQALLDAMTDSLSAGILVVDQELNVLRVNPSALKILASRETQQAWMGKPLSASLGSAPEFLQAVEAIVKSAAPVARAEVRVTQGGQTRVIGYSGVPVKNATGERLGSSLLFQDITAYVKPKS